MPSGTVRKKSPVSRRVSQPPRGTKIARMVSLQEAAELRTLLNTLLSESVQGLTQREISAQLGVPLAEGSIVKHGTREMSLQRSIEARCRQGYSYEIIERPPRQPGSNGTLRFIAHA